MAKRRRVRVRDLHDGQAYASLMCDKCYASYSADKRDYFLLSPETIMRSGCCKAPLVLVWKAEYAGAVQS